MHATLHTYIHLLIRIYIYSLICLDVYTCTNIMHANLRVYVSHICMHTCMNTHRIPVTRVIASYICMHVGIHLWILACFVFDMYSQSHLRWHFRKLKARNSNVSFATFQWKETFELWSLSFETAFENVTPSGIGCIAHEDKVFAHDYLSHTNTRSFSLSLTHTHIHSLTHPLV